MSGVYPIWNIVQACIYESKKNWGAKKDCSVDVKVGTGPKNSYQFVSHKTTCRDIDGGKNFRFYVDDVLIKEAFVKDGKIDVVFQAQVGSND